jgi:hypothetical protein
MERNNLTGLQAVEALTRAAQTTQMTLVDVARWVVEYHEELMRR